MDALPVARLNIVAIRLRSNQAGASRPAQHTSSSSSSKLLSHQGTMHKRNPSKSINNPVADELCAAELVDEVQVIWHVQCLVYTCTT